MQWLKFIALNIVVDTNFHLRRVLVLVVEDSKKLVPFVLIGCTLIDSDSGVKPHVDVTVRSAENDNCITFSARFLSARRVSLCVLLSLLSKYYAPHKKFFLTAHSLPQSVGHKQASLLEFSKFDDSFVCILECKVTQRIVLAENIVRES